MNSQQIFDEVVEHIRNQGRQASNLAGNCLYRATVYDNDGNPIGALKCAIGALIPDSKYDKCIEGYDVYDVCRLGYVPHKYRNSHKKVDLLMDLQNCHDRSKPNTVYFLRDFEARARLCAREFNLVYTPPQQQTKG